MSRVIDLNADIGEGLSGDAEIIAVVSSCNIACGGHAGDDDTMRAALIAARKAGTSAGAHPSYADPANFGRVSIDLPTDELIASLKNQIERLRVHAHSLGMALSHVKPHGALYHDAANNLHLAGALVEMLKENYPGAALFGPPNSALQTAANDAQCRFIAEGFADRAYDDSGQLIPRALKGAVLERENDRMAQALSLAADGSVQTFSGKRISLPVQTICVHGDSPGALATAKAIKSKFQAHGICVQAAT